jgi:hypothetical protein
MKGVVAQGGRHVYFAQPPWPADSAFLPYRFRWSLVHFPLYVQLCTGSIGGSLSSAPRTDRERSPPSGSTSLPASLAGKRVRIRVAMRGSSRMVSVACAV